MFLLQRTQIEESAESSSQGSAPWDQPLNRAINKTLGKPLHQRPAHGRVVGAGIGAKWDHYYHDDKEERKKRRKLAEDATDEKIESMVDEKVNSIVQDEVARQIQVAVPNMMLILKEWFDGGQQGSNPLQDLLPINAEAPTSEAAVTRTTLPVNAEAPAAVVNAPAVNATTPTPDVVANDDMVVNATNPTVVGIPFGYLP